MVVTSEACSLCLYKGMSKSSTAMNNSGGQTARKHNAFADNVRWQKHKK